MNCKLCKKVIEDDSVFCRFCGKKQITTESKKRTRRPNSTGTVTRAKDKRDKPWRARMTVNGKQITIGYYATKSEAFLSLEQFRENGIPSYYNYTVRQIYEKVIEQKRDTLTKSGLTNYVSGFKYLEPYADMKMRDLKTLHIQEAINKAASEGIGFATWKKIQNIASLMCQLAMANDLIDKNYAQLVTLPKHEKTEKSSFSREQLAELWDLFAYKKEHEICAILFLCYTGLRLNEFLSLTKDNIDRENMVLHAAGSKTEAGKNRLIILPSKIAPVLDVLLSLPGDYLYPSPTGKKFDAKNFRDRVFNKILDKYGLNPNGDITPHSCRHTFALLCVAADVAQKATMDTLGHTKYSTSADIYANATKKDIEFLRKEIDKISQI